MTKKLCRILPFHHWPCNQVKLFWKHCPWLGFTFFGGKGIFCTIKIMEALFSNSVTCRAEQSPPLNTACLLDYNGILSFHGSTDRQVHRLFLHDAQRWTLPEGQGKGRGTGIGKNQWEHIQQWRCSSWQWLLQLHGLQRECAVGGFGKVSCLNSNSLGLERAWMFAVNNMHLYWFENTNFNATELSLYKMIIQWCNQDSQYDKALL
jgi:hypothetical protein